MTTPERPVRLDQAITPKTADALLLVMTHDGVTLAEALRRLVSYGELVFRTARLVEGGEVLVRHGDDIQRIVLLDQQGDPVARDVAPLVWMRPEWSKVACAFPLAEVAAELEPLEPIARCDQWSIADLVLVHKGERCPACVRAARRWSAR